MSDLVGWIGFILLLLALGWLAYAGREKLRDTFSDRDR